MLLRYLSLAALPALVVVLIGSVSFAQAGTYDVHMCDNVNNSMSPMSATSWGGSSWYVDRCGDESMGGILTETYPMWSSTSDIPNGAGTGFSLSAPSGTNFTRVLYRAGVDGQGGGARCVGAFDAGSTLIDGSQTCVANSFAEQNTGWVSHDVSTNTSLIQLMNFCTYGPCNGGSNSVFGSYWDDIVLRITDNDAPDLSDGGGLWSKGNQWVRGSWSLSWNGDDSMGIKRHRYLIDDSEKGKSSDFCSPALYGVYFGATTKPCPGKNEAGYSGASFTINTADYSNGDHTLKIQSYDATDNIGESSTTLKVDNTSPAMIAVSGVGSWTNDSTPTLSPNGSDDQSGIAGYQCAVDGGSYGNCTSPYTTPALADGAHSVCFKAYNNAVDSNGTPLYSDSSCQSFSISTVPPSASMTNPGAWLSNGTSLTGTAGDAISGLNDVKVQAGYNGSWQDLCSYNVGANSYQPNCTADVSSLVDGRTYAIRVLATNNAGTSQPSTSYDMTVDKSPPTPPSISSGPDDGSWINSSSTAYVFAATDAGIGVASYSCSIDSGSWSTCTSPVNLTSLSDGSHSLEVNATDQFGQTGPSTLRTVSVDTTSPEIGFESLSNYLSGTVSVNGSAVDNGSQVDSSSLKLQVKPSGGAYTNICVTPSWSLIDQRATCSWNTGALTDGSYTVRFEAADIAGNASVPVTKSIVVDNSPPSASLSSATRYPVWAVGDSVSGIDGSKTIAEYSLNGGSSWQELNYFTLNEAGNQFSAAFPDSISFGTAVSVRLKVYNQAGGLRQISSNYTLPKSLPQNNSLPSFTGTLTSGQTLASNVGSWSGLATISYTAQWQRCNQDGSGCATVYTGNNYLLTDSDANKRIKLRVSATNSDGTTLAESSLSNIISGLPIAARDLPAISGLMKVSQPVATNTGNWNGTPPFAYSYQWLRCTDTTIVSCQEISGATQSSYDITSADIDKRLRSRVSANNLAVLGGAQATQTSDPSEVVSALAPSGTGDPTISGSFYDGLPLTASDGAWSGSQPLNYTYQWQSCDFDGSNCQDYPGADQKTFTPPTSLVGKTLRVKVWADNSSLTGGGNSQQTSPATTQILQSKASNLNPPVVSGLTAVKQTMNVSTGTWQGYTPFEYLYQWQRCDLDNNCQPIDGATGSNYQLTQADYGSKIKVGVAAKNFAGQTEVVSQAYGPVTRALEPPVNQSLPSIVGAAKAGQSLTISPGTWSGYGVIGYSYTWYRCSSSGSDCVVIRSGTDQYLLSDNDVDKRILVTVRASNEDGEATVNSPSTEAIVPVKPLSDRSPSISGKAKRGQTVTVNPGSWRGESPMSKIYNWYRCLDRDSCVFIDQGDSLALTAREAGQYLMVKERATNSFGSAESASALLGPIEDSVDAPKLGKAPTLTGSARVGQTLTSGQGLWSGLGPISFNYHWQRCLDVNNCLTITGAEGESYKLTTADVGKRVRSLVTASNGGGSSEGPSDLSDIVSGGSQCLNLAAIVPAQLRIGKVKALFTGRKAGRQQGSLKLTIKVAKKRLKGAKLSVTLDKKAIKITQGAKATTFTISQAQLAPGKHLLVISLKKGKAVKVVRTVAVTPCS